MSRSGKQHYLKDTLLLSSIEHARWAALLSPRLAHGGPKSKGVRKSARPFFSQTPQLFLLSSKRAKGKWSLPHRRHRSRITSQIYTYAKRFRVRVFLARVVEGQIQLLVKASDRKDLADFFRVLAGRVAVTVTGAKKRVTRVGRFWDELCFSRMLNWGNEFHEFSSWIQKANVALDLSFPETQLVTLTPKLEGS